MEKIAFEDLLRQKAGVGLGMVILDSDTALAMATFMESMRIRLRELQSLCGPTTPDPDLLLDALHQTEKSICKQLRASSAEIAFEIRQLMYKQEGPKEKERVENMTPKEFRDRMEELSHLDTERRHIEMDNCMCDLLTELGYGEGVEIFNSVTLWYS